MSTATAKPFCSKPFSSARITCEGEVYVCCWQRSVAVGNLFEESFEAIWNGKRLAEIRAATLRGELHASCETANGCPYHFRPRGPGEQALPAYPETIEVDVPNTHCNIGGYAPTPETACIMCERAQSDFRPHRSDRLLEALTTLRPLVGHLTRIHVQGVAEAMWQDYFFRVLDALEFDRHRDRVLVSVISNGIVFDADKRRRFFERCPRSAAHFSVDAATRETYVKVRRLDAFDRVSVANERSNGTPVLKFKTI